MITKQLSLCTRCHKPQAGHYWVNEAQFGKWLLVCPPATWQAPQEAAVEKPKPLVIDGIPRRNRVDRWSPGEHAINDLLWKIERLGAHVYLTDVVNFLQQAQARLADWVERPGAPDGPWPAEWQAPQELDVPVRHDTGTAEAVPGRTMERLHADSTPESLATQLAAMTAERDDARDQLAGCCACQYDGRGALTSECQEHQEQREAFAALRTALAQLVTEEEDRVFLGER